ncbi:hypothetical protein ACF06X_33720 [Streptomyces sp. NPDC015346]|uniref:hypothetical protein n=1 Tax=Streptomyces sp. NPDC015346 TaxID=3364954 RepID=UPI0036FDBB36
MSESQVVTVLIVAVYVFAGVAFLLLTDCTPRNVMIHGREQSRQLDAAAGDAPGVMALVFSLVWLMFLALWPVGLVQTVLSALRKRTRADGTGA